MARRRGRLAILIILCLFAAGCTAAPKAEWGDVKVELSTGVADIKSNLGPDSVDFEQNLVDCNGGVVSLEGRLATSTFYTSHQVLSNLTYATVATVAIEEMTFSDASEVAEGAGIRVQVKDWSSPLNPDTSGGNGDLTSKDTLVGEWFVIAIIPGSENIAEGLGIIEQWHQPIKMEGWMVGDMKGGEVSDSCELDADAPGGGGNFLSATLIITEIETESGVVSLDGDDDDEWVVGDISIVGRWGYLVILILGGFGGGAGLFIYSTILIRKSADDAALNLMGEESFSAAKGVSEQAKKDAESHSGPERSRRREEPEVVETPEVVEIAGFSLDNVLSSSTPSGSSGPPKEAGGGGVVATQESEEMDKTVKSAPPTTTDASAAPASMSMPSISSSPPTTSDSGGVTATQAASEPKRGHFSSVMSSGSSQSPVSEKPAAQRKVRKKRSVKKTATQTSDEPQPEPAQRSPPQERTPPKPRKSMADEDFEDFSL